MKVLSFNVGYFLGFPAQRYWIRRPHRLLLGNRAVEADGMDALVELVAEERPDVAAVQEVDMGSFRSECSNQVDAVANRLERRGLEYRLRGDSKYGADSTAGSLPMLRHMGNMVLYEYGTAKREYLSSGVKRLVHVVHRDDDPNVVSVHLSKTRETRREQLRQLVDIVSEHEPAIVTGDFNVKNEEDYRILTEPAELELQKPGKTFSTAHPTHAYDVFLTPRSMDVTRCEKLDSVRFSDHFPVVLETE